MKLVIRSADKIEVGDVIVTSGGVQKHVATVTVRGKSRVISTFENDRFDVPEEHLFIVDLDPRP